MIFELLYSLRTEASFLGWLNVRALHPLPGDRRDAHGHASGLPVGAPGSSGSCNASRLVKSCARTGHSHT